MVVKHQPHQVLVEKMMMKRCLSSFYLFTNCFCWAIGDMYYILFLDNVSLDFVHMNLE